MDKNRLLESIKVHEGYRETPYLDTRNLFTVGYGRLIDAEYRRLFCNPDDHEKWLHDDLDECVQRAKTYAGEKWASLTDAQREVLAEMAFQMGNRIHQFRKMRQGIEDDDPVEVIEQMKDSNWYKQTPNRVHDLIEKWQSE